MYRFHCNLFRIDSPVRPFLKGCLGVVFILCFLSLPPAFSQSSPPKFKHITVADGLSQNTVSSILKDSKGFMWFGTWDGLNKYDGYSSTIYQNDADDSSSISGNRVVDMLEDKEGNIWIATADKGVSMLDRDTGRFRQFLASKDQPNSLSSNHATSIFQDKKGIIWIGTIGGGLNRLDPAKLTFTHYKSLPEDPNSLSNNKVTRVYEDRQGNLWVGTDGGGLELFDRSQNSFVHHQHDPDNQNSISHNHVRSIFEDSKGNLWVGTNEGLNLFRENASDFMRYLPDATSPASISHQVILSLEEDREGNLWVGTENGGVNIFNSRQQEFTHITSNDTDPSGLNSLSIYSIYRDEHHNMWVGTFNGGVNWVDQHEKAFKSYKHLANNTNSLSENFVNAFVQDKEDHVWISTNGGGLNRFNPAKETFKHYKHEPGNANSLIGNFMIGLLVDQEDNIWAGSWEAGLTKINPDRTKFTRFQHDPDNPRSLSSNNPNSLAQDQEGNILLGTYGGGLNVFEEQSNSFTRHQHDAFQPNSLNSNYLRTVLVDQNNNVWIGTLGGGLCFWDRKQNKFHRHFYKEGDSKSLASNDIYSLYEDEKGIIWVGSSAGLNRFDPVNGNFSVYTKKDGLPSNTIMGIEQDIKGNFWLGTKLGISKFNPETNLIRNYTQEDGLQGNEFNKASLKTEEGKLYFGGIGGFTVFHPDSIKDNPLVPPVYITHFQIFNKEVVAGAEDSPLQKVITETKEISLSHDQSVFSFGFAALNYTIPQKNQYAYKMEGFDKDWNYVGNKRTATYTNLNPGSYVFKVKAANNDGIWNEDPTLLHITIIPPWWASWWFRVVAAGMLIGFVGLYYKNNVRRIEKENKKLDKQVEERTRALMEANDEVALQRDLVSEQMAKLLEAQLIIQKQNREILLHNQSLDQEVRIRTKELVEYNQQLEQFAFITGHNLRAPVARILGLGQLLKMPGIAAKEKKLIREKLIYTTEELDRVVKDLNTILDIRKDHSMVKSVIELNEQLNIIRDNIENDILGTQAEIAGDFSEVNTIYSVKPYISSILFNLVHNGIKYRHPDRKPQISVKAKTLQDAVCLVISDNGLGVDLSLHKKNMFSLYKRFHTHVEGKGMGLYLVKTQVAALGGKIEVESQLNVGTTFRIFLKNHDPQQDSFPESLQ